MKTTVFMRVKRKLNMLIYIYSLGKTWLAKLIVSVITEWIIWYWLLHLMSNSGFSWLFSKSFGLLSRCGRLRQVQMAVAWPLLINLTVARHNNSHLSHYSPCCENIACEIQNHIMSAHVTLHPSKHTHTVKVIWQYTYISTGTTQKWETSPLCYLGEIKACVLAI